MVWLSAASQDSSSVRPTRIVAVCLGLLVLGAAASEADRRGTGKRRGSQPPRTTTSVTAPTQIVQPSIPRSLLPPAGMGSAANVGPGFYRQMNAPPPSHGGGVKIPNVVYVYPYLPYNVAPPVVDSSASPSQAINPNEPVYDSAPPAQDRQPIYIERRTSNNDGPRQTPQPVYIVERPATTSTGGATPPSASLPAAPAPTPPPPAAPPKPKVASAVVFAIQPEDSKVYLDDDLMGTAESVNGRSEGWVLEPGVHVLEVVHPQHKTQRLVFGVGSGEPMEVIVDLSATTPQRRSRIR